VKLAYETESSCAGRASATRLFRRGGRRVAYIGHATSLKNPAAKAAVKQIEDDEWGHRRNVFAIMQQYDIPVSRFYEFKFHVIGRVISASCHVISWFMPYFFAGKLESGNVCEYFVMMKYFHALGIKEHEVYFLEQIKDSKWLPYFERVFSWGKQTTANDVDLADKLPVETSSQYCKTFKAHEVEAANRQIKGQP
jgi:hypothetical protein